MDRDRPPSAPKKMKFAPKPSAARGPSRAKSNRDDGNDKEHQTSRGPNVDKKSSEHGDDTDSDEEYKEPWDYKSNYPITLPLRKPNSGDPNLLDKMEFEEAPPYDENAISSASELGLLAENKDDTPGMFLFQFPHLPRRKSDVNSKGKEVDGSSSKELCNLEDLPEGYLGKMLVYKSGDIKMKLGDVAFDVSNGGDATQAQNAVAINKKERHFCVLGDVTKCAIVSLDADSILQEEEKER